MKQALRLHAAIALLSTPGLAMAASFQLLEQSPAQLGKAFAGTASDPTDASTVFFNPAAMSRLDRVTLTAGINLVDVKADFNDDGSTYPGDTGNTEELGVIPNLYAVVPLSSGFAVGFGVNAPYGLASRFGDTWMGRYAATDSELEVVNVNVTTSWALGDVFAVGVGVNYQTIEATLESQVDSTFGIAPDPSTDSSAKIKGDDDDFVLDLSVLLTPTESTSLGLLWREGGEFSLSGDATFNLNAICSPGAGYPTGAPPAPTTGTLCAGGLTALAGDIEADVALPDTLTFSATQWFSPAFALHLDVAQTKWSSIQEVRVVNTGNGATVDTLDLRYDDTMRYAIGATLKLSDSWTWRAGVALDEAPQTDPEHVSVRIPDADRTWLALGTTLALSDHLSLDFSYAHLFVDDVSLIETDANSGRTLQGGFDSSVDILAAQVNWRF